LIRNAGARFSASHVRRNRPADSTRDSRLFWLAAILGTAGVLAAAAAIGAAIGSVHRVSMHAGRLKVAGLVLSYPQLNRAEWVLIGLAAVGATVITVAGRAVLRQRSAYRGLLGRLEILGELDDHPTVQVIAGSRPEAFCAGYLKPRVYISHGALELLSTPELEAVLAHEHHHRRLRDPLRFAFGRILSRALFFVPVMRSLRDRYADLAELNADRAAVRASAGRESPLASALLVFDASAPPGASGISPERVDSLLGQPARWRLPLWLMAASITALSALSLLIWQASGPASGRATFNLPFLSSQPCLVMMTLLPLMGCIAVLRRRARAGQISLGSA
jgi:Zn-dependent protease with chaperone function